MRASRLVAALVSVLLPFVSGCLQTSNSGASSTALTLSLSASSVVVGRDGYPATLGLTVTAPSGTETVSTSGLPTGVTASFTAVSGGPSGTLTFVGSSATPAGNSTATVTVTVGSQTVSQTFTLASAVVVKPTTTVETTSGVGGAMKQVMSTSFQVAEWTPQIFSTSSTLAAQETQLSALLPQHIRLQAVSQGIPMKSNSTASSAWDFTTLDAMAQPVLASADNSPEFQIAAAPTWMCDASGHLDVTNHLQDFADYSANLVRYYNKGGFVWGGVAFKSASTHTIPWWGIFNEFNLNGLTAAQYVTLYNTVVPAMLAVDPTIKIAALELSDYGLGTGEAGDPMLYMPTFVAASTAGGVKAQVDAVATHFYGGCDQSYTDKSMFAAVPDFVASVSYLRTQLAARSDLANVPVWVTENNVNADYALSNGMSSCTPTKTFVLDTRGSSAFFAAWRPYVFAQLAKAGNQALYQWDYASDKQYGEVSTTGAPYIGYWVDRALATAFSPTATATQSILTTSNTDASDVEALATVNSSGQVTVLVANRALAAATDNNGAGVARTIVVDLSNFSLFYAISQTQVDQTTNLTSGPALAGVTPAARMIVTLPGYGMAILKGTP
jgi:hypothetical protein